MWAREDAVDASQIGAPDSVDGPLRSEARPTRRRHIIMAMLFITLVINYLDRSNLSIAATRMSGELSLSTAQTGLIFSAFGWTYVVAQIPAGALVDRVPPRLLYAAMLVLWSLATVALGFAAGFGSLLFLRLLIGLFEAPAYPINNRIYATWFPESERARAVGFATSGQFVGLAFLTPILAWLETHYGWQSVFVVTGAVGLAWAAVWWFGYREPSAFRGINRAELRLIRHGRPVAQTERSNDPMIRGRDLRLILANRKLLGLYLGQFGLVGTTWFFLTWFPTYLVTYRHLTYIKAGLFGALPFIAAFTGVILSGMLSDLMLRRGASLGLARKLPIISGMLLSTVIIGANYVSSQTAVIALMTLAFFGNGVASITWSVVATVAPPRLTGLTGGVFNMCGNLASISIPLVIGFVATPHSFAVPIMLVAANALMGALSYIFLVGKIATPPVPEQER